MRPSGGVEYVVWKYSSSRKLGFSPHLPFESSSPRNALRVLLRDLKLPPTDPHPRAWLDPCNPCLLTFTGFLPLLGSPPSHFCSMVGETYSSVSVKLSLTALGRMVTPRQNAGTSGAPPSGRCMWWRPLESQ